ncbi:MAG: hypothetical protein IIX06_07480, partial [Bacteroidales bacterium]|nr:hypothetical protein [Bacteroidales bacterium]
MDINRAKEIISALAEGIDPTTGEVLSDDNVCNKGEVVRALYTVLNSLDAKKSKKNLPENAGKRWTNEDDKKLCEMFDAGACKKDICKTFKRTQTGIAARLVRLGKINDRDEFR